MHVLIVGANGQIGRQLVRRLGPSRHEVRAMVRSPEQQPELAALGAAETVVADLERDITQAVRGVDTVIFTAGSGPHTGPSKTESVDRDGAIRIIDAAVAAGASRFVMVSAMRTECPEQAPERLRHYLTAKRVADDHLKATDLDWTILRPGRLTDDDGSGRVHAGEGLQYGEVPRADVAAFLAALIDAENTHRRTIDVVQGETPVKEAVRSL